MPGVVARLDVTFSGRGEGPFRTDASALVSLVGRNEKIRSFSTREGVEENERMSSGSTMDGDRARPQGCELAGVSQQFSNEPGSLNPEAVPGRSVATDLASQSRHHRSR